MTLQIYVFFLILQRFLFFLFEYLTLISNSIFKPPWRLNGDGATEGAQPSLASSTLVSAEPHTTSVRTGARQSLSWS
nr:MAG TPA: hypothetical protein [Bacteriophage sp.]